MNKKGSHQWGTGEETASWLIAEESQKNVKKEKKIISKEIIKVRKYKNQWLRFCTLKWSDPDLYHYIDYKGKKQNW